jgi:hypothetical protein
MQKTISTMKRTPLMDAQTGEYNLKYNMQNLWKIFIFQLVVMIQQLKLKLHLVYNTMVFRR